MSAAFAKMELNYFEKWKSTSPTQEKEREQYWFLLKALEELKLQLQIFIDDAKVMHKEN